MLDAQQVARALEALPTSLRTLAVGLDHLGVAVDSLRDGLLLYHDLLGLPLLAQETVAQDGVHVAILELNGGGAIELLEATGPDSPVAKFIAKRGAGIHHLALQVVDCRAAIAAARAAGLTMIDSEPRPGAHGRLIAFIHPRSSGGVLLELCQRGA